MMFSNRRSRIEFLIIFLLLFLILSQTVSAIGVVPASKKYLLDNKQITYSIRLVNDEFLDKTYDLNVEGDLQKYISLNTNKISFSKDEKYKEISVKINVPTNINLPGGEYVNRIMVKEESVSATNIAAKIGVVSKLVLTAPYSGASLSTKLIAPNFIKNQQNSFSIEVTNQGVKKAKDCRGILSIQSNTNTELDLLIHKPVDIPSGVTQRYLFPWKANLNNGNYNAKAKVICDGLSVEKESNFNIGSPNIKVVKLISDNFRLGQINKFDLILESEWNKEITDVYADVSLVKDKTIIQDLKTQTSDFEKLGQRTYPLFIDTSNIEPGEYEFIITLHYMDKETIELFNILMTSKSAVIKSATGHVIGNSEQDDYTGQNSGQINLLIILIIVVIVVNGVLFYVVLKKKG